MEKIETGRLSDPELIELMHQVTNEIESRMIVYLDRCVCCGAPVPEGRQICPNCERGRDRETT
jgi:hypothetical protein